MSYDDMKNLWKSPENRPSPEETERQRAALVASLKKEHRAFYLRVGLALTLMLVPLIGMVKHVIEGGPFAFNREWAVLLLFALPWIGAVLFIRRQLRHRRAHADYDRSVGQTLRAALDANHAAQQRAKIMQGLLALSAPVMALCIWQLQVVGKARPHEAASLATLMTIVIVASWGGIFWDARKLRPEEKRLAALVAELG
ncbi:MAG: hypothetical protein QM760_12435 [Nibricoccus sp.]